ncbi:hypothetical protein SLEP1_g35861 [Rubroshorea leprosula]|uniref:Protein kinase domain-containing protein n=1 Tax=Rubroshorea leprosula TaxID=152421 RepID=A0AAV5KQ55_9ROSI|nr:hypothetical protein SLEP1_g35861 [Rubroshorea leprosula]
MLTQRGLHSISATLCFDRLALQVTIFVLNTVVVALSPDPLLLPTLPNHGTGELPSAVVDLSNSGFAAPSRSYSQDSPPEAYLRIHNNYRAAVGVRLMTWDKKVEAYAQNYANQRIRDCEPVYSNGPYGENIARSSGYLSGTEAVTMWVKSNNTCAAGKVCLEYTQIISGRSVGLGCAKVLCDNGGTFIVCNYDPPGNYIGRRLLERKRLTYSALKGLAPVNGPSIPGNGPWRDGNRSTIYPTIKDNQSSPVASPPRSAIADPPIARTVINGLPLQRWKKSTGILVGSIVGVCALFSSLGCILFFFWRKRKERAINELAFNMSFGDEFGNGTVPREFSYKELSKATKNFAEEEKLGEGGFGYVYKGFLRDSNADVAVKRISRKSKQGIKEYTSEVKIISRLRHKNLVKLIGWCHEKELLLVYEFMPNGSLDSHLFKGRSILPWNLRFKIVQGSGSALLYLHELGDFCVLHRDIKTSNIMLDSAFNAKLGDFGLARLVDHEKGFRTTLLAGTMGYMAPECHRTGKASKESDIYSFGVVALEIVCGRRSIEPRYDEDQASLLAWVWEAYGNQRLLDVVDKKLSKNFEMKEVERSLIVGLWCAHPDHNMRPSIKEAMRVLNFETALPNLPMVVALSPHPLLLPTLPNHGTGELPSAVVDLSNSGFAAPSRSYSQDSSPEAYLRIHNNYRAAVGVRPMTWDKKVAAYAQNYANQRIRDCELVYSNGPYGENIARSSGNLSGTEAVTMWVKSNNTCAAGKVCGEYTQIITGRSIGLGCAKVLCDNGGTFIVCNYDPPGNYIGRRLLGRNQLINSSSMSPGLGAAAPTISGLGPGRVIDPSTIYPRIKDNQSSPVASPPSSAIADPPIAQSSPVAIRSSSAMADPPIARTMINGLPLQRRKKSTGILVGSIVGVCALFSSLGCILFFFWRKRKERAINERAFKMSFGDEFGNGTVPREFSYKELSKATKNFAEEEKLGEGGFGYVYKGFLRDSNADVAVKRISRKSKQGIKEYTSEVKIISRLRHKNLVKLIGG